LVQVSKEQQFVYYVGYNEDAGIWVFTSAVTQAVLSLTQFSVITRLQNCNSQH